MRRISLGALLALPAFAIVCVVVLYPVCSTILLSFFYSDLLNPQRGTYFVGLDNYVIVLQRDWFPAVFSNTVLITAGTVVIQLLLAFPFAFLLKDPFKGRGVFRGLTILPWAVPTVVAAFVWRWMLDVQYGILNLLVGANISWLGDASLALPAVVVAHVWKGMPFMILIILAGLLTIPQDTQDAARVDGATSWQNFRYITVPSMKTFLVIAIVLRVIWTFNWFDYVYVLTAGGPGMATRTLALSVYFEFFRTWKAGIARAIASIMFLTMVGFMVLFFRLRAREEGEK